MTREEAIERLEDTFEGWERWNPHNDSPASKLSKALGMAIAALREQPRWIPVEERLPEAFQPVLVYRKNKLGKKVVEVGYYCGERGWKTVGQPTKSVTHWQPLPEGPKEEV